MPRFGISDEDLDSVASSYGGQENDHYFRRFMYSSMQFLRGKKFSRAHSEAVQHAGEQANRNATARVAAAHRFDEKRRRHEEAFKAAGSASNVLNVSTACCSEKEFANVTESWLEEYLHPSCTAAISADGVVGEVEGGGGMRLRREGSEWKKGEEADQSRLSTKGALASDSHLSNNSIPSHLFDQSSTANSSRLNFSTDSVFGDSSKKPSTPFSLSSSTIGGSSHGGPLSHKNLNFHLDQYSGARPSFGGGILTSTPLQKQLPRDSPSNSPSLPSLPSNQPAPAATTTKASPVVNIKNKENVPSRTPLYRTDSGPTKSGSPIVTVQAIVTPLPPAAPSPLVVKARKSASEDRRKSEPKKTSDDSLGANFVQELDAKEDNDLGRERFEKSDKTQLRSLTKRTIGERLQLVLSSSRPSLSSPSPSHSSLSPSLSSAISLLSDLLSSSPIDGFNGLSLHLDGMDSICYARDVIAEHCMSLLEMDGSCLPSVVSLLDGICQRNEQFEKFLVGKIVSSSRIILLHNIQCADFVSELLLLPPDQRAFPINKEKALLRLFFALMAKDRPLHPSTRLSIPHIWRHLSFLLNAPHRVLASILVLNTILLECSSRLSTVYPRQWPKLVQLVKHQRLRQLDCAILSDERRQRIGEAVHISVLRNTLEDL